MLGTLFTTQDVVSSAFAAALLGTFSTAILCFFGLSWSNERWRIALALVGVVRKGNRAVRLGYFWIRLIMTIGWAIYPILHFVDVVIGIGQASGVVALYTIADLVNLVTPSLIVLAVAGQERY